MKSCLGIILLLLASNQVLCMHLPHANHRQQRSSGNVNSSTLPSPSMEKLRYCNDWAVEIHGGSEIADQIATNFGFINLGQVKIIDVHRNTMDHVIFIVSCSFLNSLTQIGNLKTTYHFQLVINETIRQDSEYHFLAFRQHGEWRMEPDWSNVQHHTITARNARHGEFAKLHAVSEFTQLHKHEC